MSNPRNIVVVIGRILNAEKIHAHYYEGTGDKKAWYSGKVMVGRNFKNKDGEYESDFIPIQAYGARAEFIHDRVEEGDIVSIAGSIRQGDSYEDKEGKTVYGSAYIVVDDISIIKKNAVEDASSKTSKATASVAPAQTAKRRLPRRSTPVNVLD